jgi:hypothetical protein
MRSPTSKIMDLEGDFHVSELSFEGNPFFRKMFYTNQTTDFDKERYYASRVEYEIYQRLQKYPQPNIVNVYHITEDYVDIELLDTCIQHRKKAMESASHAKTQLQNLNILYIDWKLDNMGMATDGTYKLFDFDVSGIVEKDDPTKWKMKPLEYYTYKTITSKHKDLTPIEIDNKAFEEHFI